MKPQKMEHKSGSKVKERNKPKLVLVEGMPGAGKTTCAKIVANKLKQEKYRIKFYSEMDDDNPIRTPEFDRIRSRHPHVEPLKGTGLNGLSLDPTIYEDRQWSKLAKKCIRGEDIIMLESRYMQNSLQMEYLEGKSERSIRERFKIINSLVADADPLLVYLRPSNVARTIKNTLEARGREYTMWLLDQFMQTEWSQRRGLSDIDGVIVFFENWDEIAKRLCKIHDGPKIEINDPQNNWEDTVKQIKFAITETGQNIKKEGAKN